jgi:hypothetical protein
MSEFITVVIRYEEGDQQPRFGYNMPCLGGIVSAVQFNDALAELEELLESEPGQPAAGQDETTSVDEFNSINGPTFMGEPVLASARKPFREFVEDENGYFLYGDMAIFYLRAKLEKLGKPPSHPEPGQPAAGQRKHAGCCDCDECMTNRGIDGDTQAQPERGEAGPVARIEKTKVVDTITWLKELPTGEYDLYMHAQPHAAAPVEGEPVAEPILWGVSAREGGVNTLDAYYSEKGAKDRAQQYKDGGYEAEYFPLYRRPRAAVPAEPTPEMLKDAQMNTEIGRYVCSQLAGGYSMLDQLWSVWRKHLIGASPDDAGGA